MLRFKEFILQSEELMFLYEFANLDFRDTGIPRIVIHAYSQGDGKKLAHGPRLKVSNVYGKYSKSDNFVIDIMTKTVVEGECKITKKEFDMIKLWIAVNKKELIKYWESEGEVITRDFYNALKKYNE